MKFTTLNPNFVQINDNLDIETITGPGLVKNHELNKGVELIQFSL